MLKDLISLGVKKQGIKLAPFIGISCPGVIEEDGSIEKRRADLSG